MRGGRPASVFGVKLAGGQGPVAGKIFRIAQMGLLDELDVISTISAVELVLVEIGKPAKLGAGVAAASRVLAEAGRDFCPNQKTLDAADSTI